MSPHDGRHSVSVAGIVVDDGGRVLLLRRRDTQRWEPPGGILELEEPIRSGVRREVHEETGLDVEPVRLAGVYKNMTRGVVALVFICKVTGGQLRTNAEASAFHWAAPDELSTMMTEAFAVRALDALRTENTAAVREHDGVHLFRAEAPRPAHKPSQH